MNLQSLKVDNFKSLIDLDVSFHNFNVLIGSNASGKSNLIDVVRFLRDIETYGLDSAISLQGGRDYLLNIRQGKNKPLVINATLSCGERDLGARVIAEQGGNTYAVTFKYVRFELEVKFKERGEGYSLKKNNLIFTYELSSGDYDDDDEDSGWHSTQVIGDYNLYLSTKPSKVKVEHDFPPDFAIQESELFFGMSIVKKRLNGSQPLIGQTYLAFFSPFGDELFRRISIFDFSPKMVKTSSPVVGKVTLEEDASNLPVVLKWLFKDKAKKNRFVRLIADLLPFIVDVKVTETTDKSLILELKEQYHRKFIPSTFLSDGTAHATALITALYFKDCEMAFFEEPERNMHPALVRKLIDHMKSYSERKQVFVTTHNTEILKSTYLEDILFISRCSEGYTKIQRLTDKSDVATFLENDIGVDELFAHNLISG